MEKLAAHVVRQGALSARDAVGWIVRLCNTLASIHAVGIPHGRVSAKAIEIASPRCEDEGYLIEAPDLTPDPAYFSPERAAGGKPSPADDVWAIGVTLYRTLTGQLPFPGTTRAQVLERIRRHAPGPLAIYDVGDDETQRIVDRVLARNPDDRIVDVDEVREALVRNNPVLGALPPLRYGRPNAADDADQAMTEVYDLDGERPPPAVAPPATRAPREYRRIGTLKGMGYRPPSDGLPVIVPLTPRPTPTAVASPPPPVPDRTVTAETLPPPPADSRREDRGDVLPGPDLRGVRRPAGHRAAALHPHLGARRPARLAGPRRTHQPGLTSRASRFAQLTVASIGPMRSRPSSSGVQRMPPVVRSAFHAPGPTVTSIQAQGRAARLTRRLTGPSPESRTSTRPISSSTAMPVVRMLRRTCARPTPAGSDSWAITVTLASRCAGLPK